jgi:hypothetical protein
VAWIATAQLSGPYVIEAGLDLSEKALKKEALEHAEGDLGRSLRVVEGFRVAARE